MQKVLAVLFGLRGHRGDPMASRVFGDLPDGVVQPELCELRRGRLARLGAPARHLVVRSPRGEEFVRIDLLALQRAVADALVEPLGQDVVRGREPLTTVEEARERVVALADL